MTLRFLTMMFALASETAPLNASRIALLVAE